MFSNLAEYPGVQDMKPTYYEYKIFAEHPTEVKKSF